MLIFNIFINYFLDATSDCVSLPTKQTKINENPLLKL